MVQTRRTLRISLLLQLLRAKYVADRYIRPIPILLVHFGGLGAANFTLVVYFGLIMWLEVTELSAVD